MLAEFLNYIRDWKPCRVLEIGTRAWDSKPPKHHKQQVLEANPSAEWIGADSSPGDGVDVVADIHHLSHHFPIARFDAVLVPWVMEHVARPWIAAVELARVVRPGGLVLVTTHQAFPHHAYPHDYFRYSTDGLAQIFSANAGWRIRDSKQEHPCKIVPLTNNFTAGHDWNFEAEAWLNTHCIAERT